MTYIRDQVCSPENARKLRTMLYDVVWGSHGTARHWVRDSVVKIAGKTGTAYINAKGQYGTQKRLAFCGFFPFEKPKYSCIVLMLGADRGAGACSGMVMRNIARKMYARGLLGNEPDFALEKPKAGAKPYPTLFASKNEKAVNYIQRAFNIKSAHRYASPSKVEKGVPNVIGLNVRDAINVLESAGLIVNFTGSGMVTSQNPAAGSAYNRGQRVNLRLKNS